MLKIGFLGAGKMASALASATLHARITEPQHIICSDILDGPLKTIQEKLKVKTTSSNQEVIENSDMIVLAFKPQNFPEAILDVQSAFRDDQIILSILAGVRIAKLRQYLPGKIVRVMPNTACLVGQMAAGYSAADNVGPAELKTVGQFLNAAGIALQVGEEQLDAVTAVSGSGPAFIARFIDYYIKAAVQAGLPHDVARTLTLQTFSGTAELLNQWQMKPEKLIEMVSSPNGTTVAGREILEASQAEKIIEATIARATERSRELGQ